MASSSAHGASALLKGLQQSWHGDLKDFRIGFRHFPQRIQSPRGNEPIVSVGLLDEKPQNFLAILATPVDERQEAGRVHPYKPGFFGNAQAQKLGTCTFYELWMASG